MASVIVNYRGTAYQNKTINFPNPIADAIVPLLVVGGFIYGYVVEDDSDIPFYIIGSGSNRVGTAIIVFVTETNNNTYAPQT